uniref:Fibronectin type-III domain-containing protein n=1 Tax=Romanomermis culicivorax TaxID=13658 RepID=A0A915IQX3_ROMCU
MSDDIRGQVKAPGPVNDLELSSASSNSLEVKWRPPETSDGQPLIVRGYNIGWGKKSAEELVQFVADDVHSYKIEELAVPDVRLPDQFRCFHANVNVLSWDFLEEAYDKIVDLRRIYTYKAALR